MCDCRSFKHLSRQSGFASCLCSLVKNYKSKSFIRAVFDHLVPAAFKQSVEQASSAESSETESDVVAVNHLHILHQILSDVEISPDIADDVVR